MHSTRKGYAFASLIMQALTIGGFCENGAMLGQTPANKHRHCYATTRRSGTSMSLAAAHRPITAMTETIVGRSNQHHQGAASSPALTSGIVAVAA
jgi:hypothetical protein